MGSISSCLFGHPRFWFQRTSSTDIILAPGHSRFTCYNCVSDGSPMRTKSIVVGRAMITCVAVHFQECITSAVRMWRLSVWTVLCVHRYVQILQTGGKSSFMSSSWSRNQVLLGIYTLYRYPTLPNLKVRNNHRDWIRLHTDKLHLTASYCILLHLTSPHHFAHRSGQIQSSWTRCPLP